MKVYLVWERYSHYGEYRNLSLMGIYQNRSDAVDCMRDWENSELDHRYEYFINEEEVR